MNEKERELLRALIFMLATVIILSLFLYVFFPSEFLSTGGAAGPGNLSAPLSGAENRFPECIFGQQIPCSNYMNCTGHRVCRGGKWSECIIWKLCTPGTKTGCFVDSCRMGYATCNSCGTAYENCTP